MWTPICAPLTLASLFMTFLGKQTKAKTQTLIHPIFTWLPVSVSVASTRTVLSERSDLRVQHSDMCARGGSGEDFFAPVSFLICFRATLAQLGQTFPSLSQHRAQASSVGKKKKALAAPAFTQRYRRRVELSFALIFVTLSRKLLTWGLA